MRTRALGRSGLQVTADVYAQAEAEQVRGESLQELPRHQIVLAIIDELFPGRGVRG